MTLNPRKIKRRRKSRARAPVHTAKWDRCVREVAARGARYNPEAVCTSELGERESILARHGRRKNPRKLSRRDRLRTAVGALVGRPRWIVTDSQGNERLMNPRRGNPRSGEYWTIVAVNLRTGTLLSYEGDRFATAASVRAPTVKFSSRAVALRFVEYLRREFSKQLRGWVLRVHHFEPLE